MQSSITSRFCVALGALALAAPAARAALVDVATSGGTTSDNVWTVPDGDFGNYTVTVSGYGNRSTSSGINYYRNSSASGENDATLNWTVSGLDASANVSYFRLDTTKITPSVGSGSSWNYTVTLSAMDVDTNATVSQVQTISGSTANVPTLAISGNFGNAPVFSLLIDEGSPFTSRTIGTYNFTITAAAATSSTPEPAAIASLLGVVMIGMRRTRSQ